MPTAKKIFRVSAVFSKVHEGLLLTKRPHAESTTQTGFKATVLTVVWTKPSSQNSEVRAVEEELLVVEHYFDFWELSGIFTEVVHVFQVVLFVNFLLQLERVLKSHDWKNWAINLVLHNPRLFIRIQNQNWVNSKVVHTVEHIGQVLARIDVRIVEDLQDLEEILLARDGSVVQIFLAK